MRTLRREAPALDILLIGGGGREHALAWALLRSPRCGRLLVAPGNPGTAALATNLPDLDVTDHAGVAALCRREAIGLVVVGPEAPLVAGLVDALETEGIPAFGPTAAAARLEGSKGFTKALCAANGIPTAPFARFVGRDAALAHLRAGPIPVVVKADGLAAGKGVVVARTLSEAEAAVEHMLGGRLGSAGAEVVIEAFLEGEEASFFALCDGTRALPFGTAQDHKRAYDGDRGPNTGGMGAYSPAAVLTPELQARVMETIIAPTLRGMAALGAPYRGILYAGLMLTADGPQLIEYNCRLGDPEAQVLLPRLACDLVEAFLAAREGRLDTLALDWSEEAALTVVLAAEGYPGAVRRGSTIGGVAEAEALDGVQVFHAATALEGGRLVAAGGRVLNLVGRGRTVTEARTRAYAGVARIDWPEGFCRQDIGWRAVERERAGA